ncbi:glycosyltransferase [Bacillus toyonensis]|uniref:Glycosyl transferase n=2 Tax=Bacillus toyonensis TaxID=155322 RepID=A0AB73S9M6_9BACI|nr:glycosyltransferase [Bacillus toyonensis]PEI88016.1 glycosyl transferase [Bacillus toyonensis]PEK08960.1 glycosyl transferase [Bacillus toyonensis]PEK55685.1 glycosyl transferase [Bacillus toyonensis]PEL55076.1 glycosyl transferase [Bacillus toyonensis]PEM12502.1 glycosyl transferase [Bacillus toyonensis]
MKKKRILITSFDMEIGGVERSLIGLLNTIDYSKYDIDLMLFKHEGGFFSLLPKEPNLLEELQQYTTFRKSIKQILQEGHFSIGITRVIGKVMGVMHGRFVNSKEPGYFVIQYGWRISLPFLPKLREEYDVAISFLWPHYFIGDKVRAKRKIGWIHTDYSNIQLNKEMECKMWGEIDDIVAVSESCRETFLNSLPYINKEVQVIENIIDSEFVCEQSNEGDITQEISINSKRIKLITVARLSHAKGIDDAIYALRQLLDQRYDIEWYIVGYGPQEAELKLLIDKLGLQDKFVLLGKKINPYPYIKACDIYVQPSRYEGKAVTVREAQILKKPVLITNFSTAKSQLENGVDGYICPMGIKGIVEGIKKMIDDVEFRNEIVNNVSQKNYGNEIEVEKIYRLIELE